MRLGKPSGVRVDEDVSVHAVDGGALIVDEASMAVRRLDRTELLSLDSLDGVEPILSGDGPTVAAVSPDGNAAFVDEEAGTVVFLRPDGSTRTSPALELTDDITSVTTLGHDTAVFSDADGDLFRADDGTARPLDSAVPRRPVARAAAAGSRRRPRRRRGGRWADRRRPTGGR